MCKAAADRAAIADLIMRHMANGFGEQRMLGRNAIIALDVAPAHERAERDAIRAERDSFQLS